MRKYVTLVVGLTAAIAVSVVGFATAAGGETPVTVKVGELELTANGGFSPTTLSKTSYTPVAVRASGEVKLTGGGHPPAGREVLIEIDKNALIRTQGLPTCKPGSLQATDTAAAEKACKAAIIGSGQAIAQVAFAEQKPIDVPSKLLVFNGGERGGKITMYIHAYFLNPISGAIVTAVTFTRIHHGRFGWLADAKVPQITGGSGSITSFNLTIDKKYMLNGKKASVFSGKCTDGKVKVHVLVKFENGTQAQTEIIRTCTPKG